ncbi:MAG TPA: hypothetical protein VFF73_13050, partial [Planctomycetota bacterium]|nr:hypothetical protein [Planctomycetota bacterium]
RGASVTYLIGAGKKLETSTGDDGRFTLRNVPREDVTLTAKSNDGTARVTALAGVTDLPDVVLAR